MSVEVDTPFRRVSPKDDPGLIGLQCKQRYILVNENEVTLKPWVFLSSTEDIDVALVLHSLMCNGG